MNIVDRIGAVGNAGYDKTARNKAQGIQLLGEIVYRDILTVEIGGNLSGYRWFGARKLGANFIQQPTENQSYKQPSDQLNRFFLKCGNRPFIVSGQLGQQSFNVQGLGNHAQPSFFI